MLLFAGSDTEEQEQGLDEGESAGLQLDPM